MSVITIVFVIVIIAAVAVVGTLPNKVDHQDDTESRDESTSGRGD